jgi:hypothetical protein
LIEAEEQPSWAFNSISWTPNAKNCDGSTRSVSSSDKFNKQRVLH